ncbi:MAG: hypothetical protein HRU09_08225 [Oligoflexales bacterium]|nr:hypothetical protein [Oligoflexales bacterium]
MAGQSRWFGLISGFFLCGLMLCNVAFAGIAQTSFVCKGKLRGGYFELRVNADLNDRIELWSSSRLLRYSYEILSDYWDMKKSGLLSAKDCFVTYENHRGCIRNVTIMGSFLDELETVSFDSCGGYHQGCD